MTPLHPSASRLPALLIVENDVRIAELMRWFLERRGFEVRSAGSLAEARGHLRQRMPDLMLSDIELGRENGREFLPQLSREGLLPRTLVVSGFLDATVAEELGILPEVVGVLAKPFEFDRLERCIHDAVARSSPRRAGEPLARMASSS